MIFSVVYLLFLWGILFVLCVLSFLPMATSANRKRKHCTIEDLNNLEGRTRAMLHAAVYTALNSRGIGVEDDRSKPCPGETVKYIFSDSSSGAPPAGERHYLGSRYFCPNDSGLDEFQYTAACAINLASVVKRHFADIPNSDQKVYQLKSAGYISKRDRMVYQDIEFVVPAAVPRKEEEEEVQKTTKLE